MKLIDKRFNAEQELAKVRQFVEAASPLVASLDNAENFTAKADDLLVEIEKARKQEFERWTSEVPSRAPRGGQVKVA